MREVELKAVIDDMALRRQRIEAAGARLSYEGRLSDKRYDLASRELAMRDEVLRVRCYEAPGSGKVLLDWKGPTEMKDGYKIREEVSTSIDDLNALSKILENLGYIVTLAIDREIAQYELSSAVIRFEVYPRMDILVEVEGEPSAIEAAIDALGMNRAEFTAEKLLRFVERFEQRTGVRAAICDLEAAGDYRFRAAQG